EKSNTPPIAQPPVGPLGVPDTRGKGPNVEEQKAFLAAVKAAATSSSDAKSVVDLISTIKSHCSDVAADDSESGHLDALVKTVEDVVKKKLTEVDTIKALASSVDKTVQSLAVLKSIFDKGEGSIDGYKEARDG